MTDTRRRGVPIASAAAILVLAAIYGSGCDGDEGTTSAGPSSSSSSTSGGGGGGGQGGAGGGASAPGAINPAAQDVGNPFDATPDPDGKFIYFTASDPAVGAGVYKTTAEGGASTPVYVGDPFIGPFGIAINSAGTQLFIADPASESGMADADDSGQIFVVSPSGGDPTTLMGTQGLRPRALEVFNDGQADIVYFSGRDLAGVPGVFKIAAGGGSATPVVTGDPFVDPSGIVLAANGDIYVADAVALGTNKATIFKITKGQSVATELLAGIAVGYPVGISLLMDDSMLLVSGLNPDTLTDAVVTVDLATMTMGMYTGDADTDISKYEEPAGLHRAKNKNVFAWADSKAKQDPGAATAGTVFAISF